MPNRANADTTVSQPAFSGKADVTTIASGACWRCCSTCWACSPQAHWPASPVGMLFGGAGEAATALSPRLLEGSQVVYKFFQTSVTYPILFAVGVAITVARTGGGVHRQQLAGDCQHRFCAGGDRLLRRQRSI
ncbi:MAG: hypothetical protein ACLR9P_00785 [Escherichia coli]